MPYINDVDWDKMLKNQEDIQQELIKVHEDTTYVINDIASIMFQWNAHASELQAALIPLARLRKYFIDGNPELVAQIGISEEDIQTAYKLCTSTPDVFYETYKKGYFNRSEGEDK